ncbi:hemolysin family protein [Thermonema rossianum]|uniref:hemolysin family protein n=1 Tax=Thermonema rossianum TaxID=55505 RepID=UPI000571CE23|nr:hemolysin family protein [Thermonema rossianum]
MELLIFYALFTLLTSFLCSLLEASLLSVPESFVEMKLQEGKAYARHLKAMKTDIDRPLAAILSLNTIANTIGASGVGVQANVLFPEVSPLIFSGGLTIAILVFSEIIPKTIGASYAQHIAAFAVGAIRVITLLMSPLVWMSGFITRLLKRNKQQSVFSRAEFFAMTQVGAKEGIFRKEEFQIIKNLLHLNSIRVSDIMTPRTVMVAADESTSIQDFYDKHPKLRFSRIPVFHENIDNITGYVLKTEMLEHLIRQKGNEPLASLKREIIFIHDTLTLPEVFNKFMQEREHIAIVVDEYGGVAGLVTMEDCVETLLGTEIMDELDNIEDLQQWARKSWEQRAARFGIRDTTPPPPET